MITVEKLDHVHVFVADRDRSAHWYGQLLGLVQDPRFDSWSRQAGGPLVLSTVSGHTALSLFQRSPDAIKTSGTIAFATDAAGFNTLVSGLETANLRNLRGDRVTAVSVVDHRLSASLYFTDPDGNSLEITTYDRDEVTALGGPA